MVTFRLHLDDANEDNGCLCVIPKSHKLGIIRQTTIKDLVSHSQAFDCTVKAGDLLLMRPHLLHSSRKSLAPSHRRVVHLEFSCYQLPEGLNWA